MSRYFAFIGKESQVKSNLVNKISVYLLEKSYSVTVIKRLKDKIQINGITSQESTDLEDFPNMKKAFITPDGKKSVLRLYGVEFMQDKSNHMDFEGISYAKIS